MSKPVADAYTLRQHLLAEARQTGKPDPDLLATPPPGTELLWGAYVALSETRASGQGAIAPSELIAHQQLYRVRFSPWEVETLQDMARAVAAFVAANKPKPRKSHP